MSPKWMPILALLGAGAILMGCTASLVGAVGPPWPDQLHDGQGNCLPAANVVDRCGWVIGVLNSRSDAPTYIYVGKRDRKTARDNGNVTITDVLPFPRLKSDETWERSVCRNTSLEDPTIMAVIGNSRVEWLPARSWAYGVDMRSGKFVPMDPKKVDCYNTALGAE